MAGQKRLSTDSWLEPDPINRLFGRLTPAGPVRLDGHDWAAEFLAVKMTKHVPTTVVELFEVARGAMLYGWFYYPLFRLGEEQLYRVSEAAARTRYRTAEGPLPRPSYAQAIEFLVEEGLIASEHEERWTEMRKLRNMSSHSEQQAVMTPGAVLSSLRRVAENIESLFSH